MIIEPPRLMTWRSNCPVNRQVGNSPAAIIEGLKAVLHGFL
jgi:hypothetical protein